MLSTAIFEPGWRAQAGRSAPTIFLIAAHALALDCVMVTDNEAEFSRVPSLSVENWLR